MGASASGHYWRGFHSVQLEFVEFLTLLPFVESESCLLESALVCFLHVFEVKVRIRLGIRIVPSRTFSISGLVSKVCGEVRRQVQS